MNNRKLFLNVLGICGCGCAMSAYADDIAMNMARMQAMDKVTGHVTEIDVPVGGIANFGSFSILARKCVTHSPEETPEDTAFIDVVDNYESENPVNIFKGWMFSSTPSLSAVEHPIYDVWLLKCYNNTKLDKNSLLSEEQLALRDTLPMQRPEKVKVNVGEIADMSDVDATQEDQNLKSVTNIDNNVKEDNLSDEDFASEGEESFEPDVAVNNKQETLAE